MSFYISDIHIRGGGNSSKAQKPTVASPGTIHIPDDVPAQLDDISHCWWVEGGPENCYKRLENFYNSHGQPTDY